jgi:hypothetical protein
MMTLWLMSIEAFNKAIVRKWTLLKIAIKLQIILLSKINRNPINLLTQILNNSQIIKLAI